MQDCDEAIAHDAKEFAAWFNKGNAQARLEDYAEALESYRQAADLAPGIAGYRRGSFFFIFFGKWLTATDRPFILSEMQLPSMWHPLSWTD